MLRLLMLLKTRGPNAFHSFCQVLEENECEEAAKVLQEAEASTREGMQYDMGLQQWCNSDATVLQEAGVCT